MPGFILLLSCAGLTAAESAVEADFVIHGASIHDGSGNPAAIGDVGIKGERIIAIGAFTTAGAPRGLDGHGLIVAPGFIDLHTHSDGALTHPELRANRAYLFQGVTTVVTGNCGAGPVDLAAYFKALETGKVGTNVIDLAGHTDIRLKVMGNADRPPTAEELRRMEGLVDRAMKDGAWGLSTGLMYEPGAFAKTDELTDLAKVVARHGGLYASHIRDQGTAALAAIDEALTIGRDAGLPVQLSHLKASGRKAWGLAADEIALIEKARRAGQAVTADQYPYTASSTVLSAMLVPAPFRAGEHKDFLARLDDPDLGPKVRKAIADALEDRGGARSMRVAHYGPKPKWQGKDLEAIAEAEGKSAQDVVLEILREGDASMVNFCMNEEDVRLIMKQPWIATASDGSAREPSDGETPHPRFYGCFPRKIGRYAIEDKVVSLEQAIRSCTGLPADILTLPERGYLKPGCWADVVVFDPETFRDAATYDRPYQTAPGVRWLFVNGRLAIDEGKYTGALAGRVLRHRDAAK
jgi:N-acyl-D-amino-acid deacylase